jgi:amino acid transporter
MTVVLSMARAASFFSGTGGPTAYLTHAFGKFAGFQVGWLFTLSRIAAFSANTNLLVTYASWFWEPLGSGMARAISGTSAPTRRAISAASNSTVSGACGSAGPSPAPDGRSGVAVFGVVVFSALPAICAQHRATRPQRWIPGARAPI